MAKSNDPVNVEVRLRRKGSKQAPTRTQVRNVIMQMVDDGFVPPGWEASVIQWQHPERRTPNWVSGDIRDLGAFGPIFQDQLQQLAIGVQAASDVTPKPQRSTFRSVTRYRLREGEKSNRYRPGQFVPKDYAKRYPGKVAKIAKRKRVPVEDEGDRWEVLVTLDYEG